MRTTKKTSPKKILQSDFSEEVYVGTQAIREFLAPENHAPLPLVELPESVNPFRKDGVRILAKLMTYLPGGQVKSGSGYEMLKTLEEKGLLEGVDTLFEASSGNMAGAETIMAPHFGEPDMKKTIIFVTPETNEGKIKLLQVLGAHVIITRDGIQTAKKEGKAKGAINPSQYDNPANPDFFYRVLGPQLWKQTQGTLSLFCAGLGSGGTIIGTGTYLKQQNPKIQTIGVIVKDGELVPAVRTKKRLKEVSLPWKKAIDRKQFVSAKDSFKQSLKLIRQAALLAGPSSGFTLQGLVQEITHMKQEGSLDDIRNENGEVVAVFPVTDSPLPYINDYFTNLDSATFPQVTKR